MRESEYWTHIHAERARLLSLLDGLAADQWQAQSLCSDWSVEQVVAHLSAAVKTGRWAWIRSIVAAGFNPAKHNARLLSRYRGRNSEETLAIFRDSTTLTVAPTRDYPAFLGEVIVHGQDIAEPRGLSLVPDRAALLEVARYFAQKDFAVNSRTLVTGLSLEAEDADFESGSGPLVTGNLLELVMTMAGRPTFAVSLRGEGAEELRHRLS
ncbi:maleylpyruvate isomerase family mycothiol-dependent enzyme [Brevibacterium aurantiacum]|uniref:Maleylpyruvate isomerase family mycothiol-dependent enzyme n=1 Tax=Brevibacterium aurantiacum TaxID=273384 RepID=A0A556CET3_BREAU|nr:maleylpyruvate isomerase family mycothiol-dependent enzyme [Brevibacterium aurantiacum]TSI15930.1 maleylpyruvate isomerase family mycothiol-dependent enzyme [Brevibacterium aurantiacum]